LLAILAGAFFVVAVVLFVLGIKNTKQLEEALAQEALAVKKAPKTKKPVKKPKPVHKVKKRK
jgi:preprotein translocase subunit SecG